MLEKVKDKVRFTTTPNEFVAIRNAWGDVLKFDRQWQGEDVGQSTPVWAEVSGVRSDIRSMFVAVRTKTDANRHSSQPFLSNCPH